MRACGNHSITCVEAYTLCVKVPEGVTDVSEEGGWRWGL